MSQFNLKNYKHLLLHAKNAGYNFIFFDQISNHTHQDHFGISQNGLSNQSANLLLRHDIDGDLYAASQMAKEEAEIGIHSTYFLMWRSPCYNLMSRSNHQFVELILEMGHQIGLHYDQGFDALRTSTFDETSLMVKKQADWMEDLFSTKISSVSFHQPSSSLLQEGVDCGKRINTYDRLKLANYNYISDSNRVFPIWQNSSKESEKSSSIKALADLFPKNVQLLIHPMWWVYDNETTEEVWDSVIYCNIKHTLRQLTETEGAYGPQRDVLVSPRK
jgi:hypothetical protein